MDKPRFPFRADEQVGFDWDTANRDKCQKHGVSTAEIESLFAAQFFFLDDPRHSQEEDRFKAVGHGSRGRSILVVFTVRVRNGQKLIRPVSARYMHGKEVMKYEEAAQEVTRAQDR